MGEPQMKVIFKSLIGITVALWITTPSRAEMLTHNYVYDQKAGTFTIVLMGPVTPLEPYSIDLNLKYKATNALFNRVHFGTASSSATSASNLNGDGEVLSSAANVRSDGGGIVAKLIFNVESTGAFQGEIVTLNINGVAYGPLILPLTNLVGGGAGAVSDQGLSSPLFMPPVQVIALGKNHAVEVLWTHPEDGVLYYQVVAHRTANDTGLPVTIGRGCVASKHHNHCTIRGLKMESRSPLLLRPFMGMALLKAQMPATLSSPPCCVGMLVF